MGDEEATAALEELYAQLPTVECQGLCWNSCGPISMSGVERRRIEAVGVTIEPFTHERSVAWNNDEPLHCAALKLHRCTVYEVRPLICRAYGVGRGELACRWGCTVTGTRLKHAEFLALIMQSFKIGGRDDSLEDDLDLDEAMVLMTDPVVASLMARYTNGERHLAAQIQDAIADAALRKKEGG